MSSLFEYTFPAIRGVQASREYYVSMCPLRLLPKIFLFDEIELKPEIRAQRILNRSRIPEISRYILNNPENYVFSSLTASIDADISFEPINPEGSRDVGLLRIPMTAKFIINDGQHRYAAIERALVENPDLGDETISIVFFIDVGLKRTQQIFADLNKYAVRPSKSLNILYDHQDSCALLTKLVVMTSPVFYDLVEMEKSHLSEQSRKLFTLSTLYSANSALLSELEGKTQKDLTKLVMEYWEEVDKYIPEWELVRTKKTTAAEVRRDFIHTHSLILNSMGIAGGTLLHTVPKDWKKRLKGIEKINWAKSDSEHWEGRIMTWGQVYKFQQNLILATNVLKKFLDLPLSKEEQKIEKRFLSSGENIDR